ncbi:facilitated trehalose transporter Tret1-2 homolog isoform X2 [Anthonomus grandis grandis]|uniref:facilitated trehalose transporter Tret1-2 homolog isoform X2 n=1 Tax=Anthonomus grandis grandis TaxID=2921223 RepID=UPI0021663C1A|nr:facilitated trehalose transporter Tret1-2 homolog isoform X2 [Anthonomus grandis grandis]
MLCQVHLKNRKSVAAIGPLLCSMCVGLTMGYSTGLIPQLQESTHNGDSIMITKEDASWVASMPVLPMAASTFIGGFFIQRYGRKRTHIISCFPQFAGWIIMYFALNLEMILMGRFLTGLAAGIVSPATGVYIGETSEPKYRGVLLGAIPLCVSIGLLVSHLLGTFLPWRLGAVIISIIPVLGWVLMTFTPESPTWLAQKGFIEKAENSFQWLRGSSEDAQHELTQMLAKINENRQCKDKTIMEKLKELRCPEFWKPMAILLFFFITSQWAGINAVNFYSVTFMKETLGNSFNEYLASFIVDCVRVVASIIACILMRKVGRRPLGIVSGIGTFIPLFLLSSFIYFTKSYGIEDSKSLSAIPITSLLMYIFFITAGFVTLPWNLIGELLPLTGRSLGSAIASCTGYMSMFTVVKTMPFLFENLSPEGTFLVYGGCALIGTVFIILYMPETKNKTLHEIEEFFKK